MPKTLAAGLNSEGSIGLISPSSVDDDKVPMPNEGMRGISEIVSHARSTNVAIMTSRPAGLGPIVAGLNGVMPPAAHSVRRENGEALTVAGLLGVLAAASMSGESSKKSEAKPATSSSPTTPSPTATKPAGPTPPPGGKAKVPEPPTSAPNPDDIVQFPVPGVPDKPAAKPAAPVKPAATSPAPKPSDGYSDSVPPSLAGTVFDPKSTHYANAKPLAPYGTPETPPTPLPPYGTP